MVMLQGVIETPAYLSQAKAEGMTEAEMKRAVDTIAADPETGDLIKGSGGFRKVRIARDGGGKSGGYRVVSFFAGRHVPAFLIAVLAKGSRANFSKAEVNAMAKLSKTLVSALGPKAVSTIKEDRR